MLDLEKKNDITKVISMTQFEFQLELDKVRLEQKAIDDAERDTAVYNLLQLKLDGEKKLWLEKACAWLKKHCGMNDSGLVQFRKAMEEEQIMTNIFKEAKFGDRFKTRDGKMAVYIKHIDDILLSHLLLVDGDGEIACSDEGLIWARHPDIEVSNDIVGKWEDESLLQYLEELEAHYRKLGQYDDGKPIRRVIEYIKSMEE